MPETRDPSVPVPHECPNCGLDYDVVTDESGFDVTCPLCNERGEEV